MFRDQNTSMKVKGVFIRAVVPDSPAAKCEKLEPGDRILAVNGVSLLGLDYERLGTLPSLSQTLHISYYNLDERLVFTVHALCLFASVSGKELIQSSGARLRLLVARSHFMAAAFQNEC